MGFSPALSVPYATVATLAAGGGIAILSSAALPFPLPLSSVALAASSALGFFFFFNNPARQLRSTPHAQQLTSHDGAPDVILDLPALLEELVVVEFVPLARNLLDVHLRQPLHGARARYLARPRAG